MTMTRIRPYLPWVALFALLCVGAGVNDILKFTRPDGVLYIGANVTNAGTLGTSGAITSGGSVTVLAGNVTSSAGGNIGFNARANLSSPSATAMQLNNSGGVIGATFTSSNIAASAKLTTAVGGSASNAVAGGTLFVNTTPIASAGTAATNMMSYTAPAHALTNAGDGLEFIVTGDFNSGNGSFVEVYWGSQLVGMSPVVPGEGGSFTMRGSITSVSPSAQVSECSWTGADTFAVAVHGRSARIAQTNGIATTLLVRATAGTTGAITNTMLWVGWRGGPR